MLVESVARFAAEQPRKTALVVNGTEVSYANLWLGACVAESRIRATPLPPGARVGIAIADLRVAWFALLALEKMGHPSFAIPQSARASQLNLSGTAVILTDGHPRNLQSLDTGVPTLNIATGVNQPSPGHLIAKADPQIERFILFSSGTTGVYKKVRLTAALRDLRIGRITRHGHYNPDSRYFIGGLGPWTLAGYHGPAAIWSIGATIIIHQPPDAISAIKATKPSIIFATPGLAQSWLRQMDGQTIPSNGVKITVGGGPLNASLCIALQEAFPGATIQQTYGTTECAGICETQIQSLDDLNGHMLREEVELGIVDEDGNPLPSGASGAIRVRSPVMVHEYLDDPAATAAFFRDGWFYPGDMGTLDATGRLVLTGRFAEVINLRGDKVAPHVLEDAIRRSTGAREVAVLSTPSAGMLDELHVFVVENAPLDQNKILASLKSITDAFSRISLHRSQGLPRNSMGKVLYGELRALAGSPKLP